MNKEQINLFTFVSAIIFIVLTFIFREKLLFGFMLLFSLMFIVDSFIYFVKNKLLKGNKPIGGGQ